MANIARVSCLLLYLQVIASDAQIVKGPGKDLFASVSTGKLRGRLASTKNGNQAGIFQGIPYAEVPVGALRYANPVPKQGSWSGALDCTAYRAACMSNSSRTTSPQRYVSEDCLHINLFVGMQCNEHTLCPVLYYIHGGAWNFDSPRMFPEAPLIDNFASKGLIFVLVGYRLGSFGFWNTATDDALGNWGMQDTVEGLRWIQREVHNFNGDPNHVTIMGHSSAAEAVSLLTKSPKLHGLFHRAISMSGGGLELSKAGLNDNQKPSQELAEKVGCATKHEWADKKFSKILSCMREKDANELLLVQRELDDQGVVFSGPRLDGPKGLFPEDPKKLATDPNRPVYDYMLGTVKHELGGAPMGIGNNVSAEIVRSACKIVAQDIFSGFTNVDRIASACFQVYTRGGEETNYLSSVTQLMSDAGFFVPTFQDATYMKNADGTVFLYEFDYVKRGFEGIGPYHAMDLTYVFGLHPFKFDDRDRQIARIYPRLFFNFAKYGVPNPNWSRLDQYNYYSVDLPTAHNRPFYHFTSVQFWLNIAPALDHAAPAHRGLPALNMAVAVDNKPNDPVKNIHTSGSNHSTTAPSHTQVQADLDWQTAFWITLVVAILFALTFAMIIGLKACHAYKAHHNDDGDEPAAVVVHQTDEKTSLLAPEVEAKKRYS